MLSRKKHHKSTCVTWGFCRLADPRSMSGSPSLLPAWLLSSCRDGSPPALEEFSTIITAFSVIYCHLNSNVSRPCLMAVGSIDCWSEWHCMTLMTSLESEWRLIRMIPHHSHSASFVSQHMSAIQSWWIKKCAWLLISSCINTHSASCLCLLFPLIG